MVNMSLKSVFKPKMWLGLKQILLYVGLLLCVLLQVCRSKTELYCPSACSCDLHEQHNRAVCSAKRLISANIEMPRTVQLLDLSYNDITNIEADAFETNVHLINLTLAHNAIHTVHIDAFLALRRLQALDLSYNRLEYVDAHLVESNPRLRYLSLEGNKLTTLARAPLLRSISLRTLNLRNAQVNELSVEALTALPRLRELDLAQNMLLTLNGGAFHASRHLRALNVDENPLNCDAAISELIALLLKRGVAVSISSCLFETQQQLSADSDAVEGDKQPASMFERLEVSSSSEEKEPQSVLDVWQPLSDDLDYVNHSVPADEELEPALVAPSYCYVEDDVRLAFIVGNAVGACIVIFIITFALCVKNGCKQQPKSSSSGGAAEVSAAGAEPVEQLLVVATEPIVVMPARTRQPRRSNPQRPAARGNGHSRALVRQPYGPQDNFISRLFGRPARQEYYRTLNQNTVTLIRRLSRSNLFLNRQSEPSSPASPPTPTPEAAIFPTEAANISQASSARPETPPPKYGDVVSIEPSDRK